MIKLFVGLGNPGTEYEATRHNAGFWWTEALAREFKLSLALDKNYHARVARTTLAGQTVWLLEPLTFMNLSGKSVAALARFFKLAPEEILVAHDELDIVPGQAKLKFGGSHAGHNGLRDIHAQLGTGDYWRLRIGVGHPGVKSEVINWVLKKPSQEHRAAIEDSIARSLKAVPALLAGEMDDLLVYRKRLRHRLDAYQVNVPPQVRAARVADDYNARINRPKQYQNGGWIRYVMTQGGPEPMEIRQSRIDYEHYLAKQLQPIADALLQPMGESFMALTTAQQGLF